MARGLSRDTTDAQKLRATIRRALPPVLSKLYEMALDGDVQAAKILIDRALPALAPVKENPSIAGNTPSEQTANLLSRVVAGEISPTDAIALLEFLRMAGGNKQGNTVRTLDPQAIKLLIAGFYDTDTKPPDR